MQIEQLEDEGLSQYSYAISCDEAEKGVVVDPRRDVDVYERWAEDRDLALSHVFETHIHADFASGARELAHRTGAELCLSAYDEDERYEVAFAHRELRDGDRIELGSVRVEALHTPGHTPEHLSFLVFDLARSADDPLLMLSGDFLFVGSLGRPDLLGEEAKRELAGQLYRSVRERLPSLPDGLEIHPGHGAGSMCGSGMGGRPVSTLGYERRTNPYLHPDLDEEEFVSRILGSVPPFPPYYRRMKEVNSAGPPILGGLPGDEAIAAADFRRLVDKEDHVVVDLRDQLAFGGSHIPGSFGIGFGSNLSTWAAWLVSYERPILLVPEVPGQVEAAVRALVRVGLDDVRGYLDGGIAAWRGEGFPLEQLPQISPRQLADRIDGSAGDGLAVLDVRTDEEWNRGHIDGATHVMGGEIEDRLDKIPSTRPLAIVCGGGYRSTAVASVLERHGLEDLFNVSGGMRAWKRAGLPTTTD